MEVLKTLRQHELNLGGDLGNPYVLLNVVASIFINVDIIITSQKVLPK